MLANAAAVHVSQHVHGNSHRLLRCVHANDGLVWEVDCPCIGSFLDADPSTHWAWPDLAVCFAQWMLLNAAQILLGSGSSNVSNMMSSAGAVLLVVVRPVLPIDVSSQVPILARPSPSAWHGRHSLPCHATLECAGVSGGAWWESVRPSCQSAQLVVPHVHSTVQHRGLQGSEPCPASRWPAECQPLQPRQFGVRVGNAVTLSPESVWLTLAMTDGLPSAVQWRAAW
jgi:hypothetical protein